MTPVQEVIERLEYLAREYREFDDGDPYYSICNAIGIAKSVLEIEEEIMAKNQNWEAKYNQLRSLLLTDGSTLIQEARDGYDGVNHNNDTQYLSFFRGWTASRMDLMRKVLEIEK
jgi:hypothetical protein